MIVRTFGSLFAGVGGFDMGFEQAGFECRFQVEWDKHCQSVLDRHWPNVPKWGDVCDVDGSWLPHVDVLIFGSPCQDLSVAGKRAGIDGGRSSMFFEATRIIKEMRNATGGTYPRVVVWENVPGALSSNKGADFQAVLNEMGDCGSLLTEWAVLDAQHFGVPQRRRRIFLVSIFDPATADRCPNPLFPVSQGRRGDYEKGIPKGQTAAGTLGGGSGSRGWSPDTDRMTFIPEVMLNFQGAKGSSITNQDDVSFTLNAMHGHDMHVVTTEMTFIPAVKAKRAMSNTDFDRWEETDLCPTLNAFDNTGESRATVIAFATNQRSEVRELGDLSVALSAEPGTNQQTYIAEPTIAFTAQRVGEAPRIYEDSTPALLSRMGTGGNNTPMIVENNAYSIREDAKANTFSATPTDTALCVNAVQPSVQSHHAQLFIAQTAIPIQDGREVEKRQNGLGVGTEGDPAYTLDTLGAQAVSHHNAVRRLTPVECERLMGWPDDHTRWTAEGKEQSDSARYKQCGNGVATPVAKWVAEQLEPLL